MLGHRNREASVNTIVLSSIFHARELKGSQVVVLEACPEESHGRSVLSVDEYLMSIPEAQLILQTDQENSPGK